MFYLYVPCRFVWSFCDAIFFSCKRQPNLTTNNASAALPAFTVPRAPLASVPLTSPLLA
jgi:hypothetical protein